VLLLEDLDLLTKTGAGSKSAHMYEQDNWHKLGKRKRVEQASGDEERKQLTFRASGLGKA
jgi:hypothetical protein